MPTGPATRPLARQINRYIRSKTAGVPAQLHFIQRFGGALDLHVHVHAVVSDGAFRTKEGALGKELVFNPVPGPSDAELEKIATSIRRQLIRRILRLGCLPAEAAADMLKWKNSGFSLHKDVVIYPDNRKGLERLLGYCSRPAISIKRLIYSAKAKVVVYRAERRDGGPGVMAMSPVEFLRRWGLLMPPRRIRTWCIITARWRRARACGRSW